MKDKYKKFYIMFDKRFKNLILCSNLNSDCGMKYKIQWQDRWGNWQHYQTKTNEADAFRVTKQMVKQKGIRHRIVDENNSLIDLLNP